MLFLRHIYIYFAGAVEATPEEIAFGQKLGAVSLIFFLIVTTVIIVMFLRAPSYIKNRQLINITRFLVPVIGGLYGFLSFLANDYQLPYLIWYPLFITFTGEALLSLAVRHETRIAKGQAKQILPTWLNRIFGVVIGIVVLGGIGYAIYNYQYDLYKSKLNSDTQKCIEDLGPKPLYKYGDEMKQYEKQLLTCDLRGRAFWPWEEDKYYVPE